MSPQGSNWGIHAINELILFDEYYWAVYGRVLLAIPLEEEDRVAL